MSDRTFVPTQPPELFKGIALFTPGGDLVYCIDPQKRNRWHIHLCGALQHLLGLTEAPHFLVPCYTATVDCWQEPQTQQIKTVAEASPLVQRYQPILNAVFQTGDLVWQPSPLNRDLCDPVVLLTYRRQFPQLWESHDLIVRYELSAAYTAQTAISAHAASADTLGSTQGYVFRLFVAGYSLATERILHKLHRLLEQALEHPYTLKVIDVSQHPEQAESNHISATPTLVRVWPQPVRRVVGSLENVEQLLVMLDDHR